MTETKEAAKTAEIVGIVDYNAGNITSVERALSFLKTPYVRSQNPKELESCGKIIFPGVGEAAYAMKQLRETGFYTFLKEWAAAKKPLLGICLGSQIIFEHSEEGDGGGTECLGILKGTNRHFSSVWKDFALRNSDAKDKAIIPDLKVPQIGWNDLTFANGGSHLLSGIAQQTDFYFVHSYVMQPSDESIIKAYTNYGCAIPACVEQDSVTAFQFHPEKSGEAGLKILKNFADLRAENS